MFDDENDPFITEDMSTGMKCLLLIAAVLALAVVLYPMAW